jgi:RNA recognition motif-containing protein
MLTRYLPSVYVRNLDERIQLEELTEALREIFGEFGNIIDIVAKQSLKRKGQAFIVYDDVESATRAIEEIQGFELFDKPMTLEYARTKSDATVKLEGNEDEFEQHKRRRLAEKGGLLSYGYGDMWIGADIVIAERKQALEAQDQNKLKRPAPGVPEPAAARPAKARGAGLKSTGGAGAVIPDEYLPPNKTLFVQNIPDDYDVEGLTALFSEFEGFREVRLVPGRKGIAFVEYEADAGAISAKEQMANIALGDSGQQIKVTYQRQ